MKVASCAHCGSSEPLALNHGDRVRKRLDSRRWKGNKRRRRPWSGVSKAGEAWSGCQIEAISPKNKTPKASVFNLISPEACGVAITLISSSGRSLHKSKTSWCQKYLPPPLMRQQSLITYRDLLLCLCRSPNCSYDLLQTLQLLVVKHKSLSSTSACTGRWSQLSTFQFECCSLLAAAGHRLKVVWSDIFST